MRRSRPGAAGLARLPLLLLFAVAAASLAPGSLAAQPLDAVSLSVTYRVDANVTYLEADGYESKLDVYAPRPPRDPRPTLLYFHGGGWVQGTKESSALTFLPYLERGWAVVNVEYRMARHALAPAAVEDVRCALRWVQRNAERYGLDPERIVTSGHSAGGHLALVAGMLPGSAGFDRRCPAAAPDGRGPADAIEPDMQVAAVVNWFGITDVGDLVEGENAKTYAVAWMGSMPDRMEVARRVSPLTWVRRGLPPVLTVHGDADTIVPYAHGERLHRALQEQGVASVLHTVPGGGHGGFELSEYRRAFEAIWRFLDQHVGGSAAAESP
jgi:acetyl esterase/lipase